MHPPLVLNTYACASNARTTNPIPSLKISQTQGPDKRAGLFPDSHREGPKLGRHRREDGHETTARIQTIQTLNAGVKNMESRPLKKMSVNNLSTFSRYQPSWSSKCSHRKIKNFVNLFDLLHIPCPNPVLLRLICPKYQGLCGASPCRLVSMFVENIRANEPACYPMGH